MDSVLEFLHTQKNIFIFIFSIFLVDSNLTLILNFRQTEPGVRCLCCRLACYLFLFMYNYLFMCRFGSFLKVLM